VVAAATLILCSCRATKQPSAGPPQEMLDGLPASAWTGAPPYGELPAPGALQGLPLPYQVAGPWSPPGIETPWPVDEYLRDGGDRSAPVAVSPDWEVQGLDLEDTVAHYDAIDGRTLVEPSNKVHIYAPRFGSVRTVTRIVESEQVNQPIGVERPEGLARSEELTVPASSLQRYQARGGISTRMLGAYRTRQGDGAISNTLGAKGFQDTFLPFEDLTLIRNGIHQSADKARLAEGVQAAVAWSHDLAVQVFLDAQAAVAVAQNERTEEVYTVKDLRNSPKLRLVKVASTQTARPGEFIDFTLRFDNVGDQPLGNIVLIDNLTTRLEYAPDSAQSSVKAEFFAQPNEGESLVLRWEIADPIEPGEGGIVRFRCRVR
jgi:uncharacterized repeat protein (TIGR01451 family)